MNEKDRLQELREFRILDTLPERELDEIAEIALAVCNVPISLISFVDDNRQWFKAKKGIDMQETPRKLSLCQHALQNPSEVLVANNLLQDERFKNHPFVLGPPHIRFYAGAPLTTRKGNVLGTLCILDYRPRKISEQQKRALQLLAKKVMDFLETRKLLLEQGSQIESSAGRLKKLTDQAPGAIFQFEMKPDGKKFFSFLSKGISDIHPNLSPQVLKENPLIAIDVIHPDDQSHVRESLYDSFTNLTPWSIEYRVILDDEKIAWHWSNANPEKQNDGTVIWYGTFQDVTVRKKYTKALEQMLSDISHVMRRPVATMLGLAEAFEIETNLSESTLREYLTHLKTVSEEMDAYIRKMNKAYSKICLNNSISSFRDYAPEPYVHRPPYPKINTSINNF